GSTLERSYPFWQTGEAKPEKCLSNESLVISLDEIQIDDKLHFVEEPVEIMDQEVKRLKQSRIPIIKCPNKYPLLFTNTTPEGN
nr:putative reverse transcriptase domain-containing protein [Tanacetum cinerariifolium]